jgi:hypothetical protein
MNPVTQMINSFKAYRLQKKDLNKLRRVRLVEGAAELREFIAGHELCVMQATAMITTQSEFDAKAAQEAMDKYHNGVLVYSREKYRYIRVDDEGNELHEPEITGYTDHPICVSEAITTFLIELNDTCSDRQRAQLKKVIPDIVNTCPIKIEEFKTKPAREVRNRTPEYRSAEAERERILGEVYGDAPFDEKLEAVKRAAAVYQTAPGLADELLQA